MTYGFFDTVNREYIITNPRTPVKWINYIGTRSFGGFVDHTGGALICKDDPALNRITKYIQQMPSSQFKGETVYLRIHKPDGFQILTPFFVPGLHELDSFKCSVGFLYTRILSECEGLQTEVTIFVPMGMNCEIRSYKFTNLSSQPIVFDVIPMVEYTHPDALKQFTNADWIPQTMQSRAVIDGDYTILTQYPFMARDFGVNYFTSNLYASSFETDRRQFLGENEYGTFRQPLSLLQPELGCHQAERGDTIATLLHSLGCLCPGESRQLITQLGQASSVEDAKVDIQRFRRKEEVDVELGRIMDFRDEYFSAQQVHTPDENMNIMLNTFNPYQCYINKNWSRYLSTYQLGMGARGIGMRDSSQDVMSVLPAIPDEGRQLIQTLLSFQKVDGSCMHQFNPLSGVANIGDSCEMEDRPHFYSDDHLWLVLAVAAYLKERGDLTFLDEIIPFYDPKKEGKSDEEGSVREHLLRGLNFTHAHLGRHGLPLLGFADWNDTVNLPEGAESLFSANLYGKALLEIIGLFEFSGHPHEAEKWRIVYDEMKACVEKNAWDGKWYLRYFDENGEPVGSERNTYGKIYLNAQTWPIISGFASPKRAQQAMDAVFEKLNTDYGIKISWPGFNGYDPKYGGITTYPPGAKENSGIFVHPNPWAIIAETMLGNGERAFQYYAQVNPAAHNEEIDTYECEPYVYAQNILSDEHPKFGLARNSWLTGSSAWNYISATQFILGIQPEFAGLRVDPCIPAEWEGFSVTRRFRNAEYLIKVHNPHHVCKGVERMTLDGQPLKGNLLPAAERTGKHQVEVWLGKASS